MAEMDNLDSYIENADPPADELEGDVLDNEIDDNTDIDTDDNKEDDDVTKDVPDSSGNKEEDGADVVKKIINKVTGQDDDSEDDDGKDIPDEFTNAALDNGWTEEQIVEFASDLDDDALLALIPELIEQDVDDGDGKQKESESDKGRTKHEAKAEAADKSTATDNTEVAKLKKELEDIRKEIGTAKKDKEAKDREAIFQTINQVFDEASKDFEIFGKTDELLKYPAGDRKGQFVPTTPAMVARKEVVNIAAPFIAEGMAIKDAMDIGLTYYKGKNLEKDIKRNVIRDLKKHEKKLSAKRSGKETTKVYESEEERREDVVREAARKAGADRMFD
jgi:hypothetical protein